MKHAVIFLLLLFLPATAQDFYIGLAGHDNGLKVWNAKTGELYLEKK